MTKQDQQLSIWNNPLSTFNSWVVLFFYFLITTFYINKINNNVTFIYFIFVFIYQKRKCSQQCKYSPALEFVTAFSIFDTRFLWKLLFACNFLMLVMQEYH